MLFLFFTSSCLCSFFPYFLMFFFLNVSNPFAKFFFSAQFISKAPFLSILFCLKGGSFASKYSSKILGIIDTRLVLMASRILWYFFICKDDSFNSDYRGKNSEVRVLIIFIQEDFFYLCNRLSWYLIKTKRYGFDREIMHCPI